MRQIDFENIRNMKGLGSSLRIILKYLMKKGAKVELVYEQTKPSERYFLVKYKDITFPLRSAKLNFYSSFNSLLAQTITVDKYKTAKVLEAYDLRTPATELFENYVQAEKFLDEYNKVVMKPLDGAHGDGITTGVTTPQQARQAVELAQEKNPQVILQEQIEGDDFRLLFINYEFVAAVKRVPAEVPGNGRSKVRELVEDYNSKISDLWRDIRAGKVEDDEVRGSVSKIPIHEIEQVRGAKLLESVPKPGEVVRLLDKANVSLGGQTIDVTDNVSGKLTEKLTYLLKQIDLPICGVDVISNDISTEQDSYIIELNAAPGLRLHEHPTTGTERPVCAMVAEALIAKYRD